MFNNKVKTTSSPHETYSLGFELAQTLSPHSCILISGSLGSGKTQLIKGFCAYFGLNPDEVQSPTYSLHHIYQGTQKLHHFDLYRLKGAKEFIDRGFLDILETPEPIFIEWPSQVGLELFQHKNRVVISIEILNPMQRSIHISHDKN